MSFESTIVESVIGCVTPHRQWSAAIVVQGPYYPVHTERAIREFLDRNPQDVLVILSTYLPQPCVDSLPLRLMEYLQSSQSTHYGRFVCISCRRPGPEQVEFWRTNFANQNLQRITSFAGLHFAKEQGCQLALKIRSDCFLAIEDCGKRMRKMIDDNPICPDGDNSQSSRILISDLSICGERNPIAGPCFIPDVWFFGYVGDLIRYFDVREGTIWNKGAGISIDFPAETNLGICWKKEMRLREDMRLAEILGRYFVVADRDDVLFFWPRWWNYEDACMQGIREFLISQPRKIDRVTHEEWLTHQSSFAKSARLAL